MNSLKTVLSKMISMPLNQIGVLVLIMITAFVKSMALTALDVGSLTLYLKTLGIVHISFTYIWSAFIMMLVGYYTLIFERRHGYGSVPICCGVLLVFASLCLWGQDGYFISSNLFFWFNLCAFGILNAAFWGVTSRFISLRMDSRKFAVVILCELLGIAVSGWMIGFGSWAEQDLLIGSLIFMTIFIALLKSLVFLSPVPSETFVQKTGGAQDILGYRLVKYLLVYACLGIVAKGVLFFALYTALLSKPTLLNHLGFLWGWFGSAGLLMMVMLYRLRYLHMIFGGTMFLAVSFIIAGIGTLMNSIFMIYTGVVLFLLTSYFYWSAFLIMLPQPLAVGRSKRIKWQRMVLMEPLGYTLSGGLLFYLYSSWQIGNILIILGGVLAGLAAFLVHLYSDILLESFKRYQWRGGPLILSNKKIIQYLTNGLKSDNADKVIYAIRILGLSNHPLFKKNLLKLLKHQNETVRLFALDRIEKCYETGAFYKTIEMVFTKDSAPCVRAKALRLLIIADYAEKGAKATTKYMRYLSDKQLRSGVIGGLLQNGGNQALMAMDTLQSLAFSKEISENIEALKIIESSPLIGLVRLVEPLMKHPDGDVAKQALLTAGAMRHPQLLGAVFEALDDVELQETALVALEKYGKQAFPPLEKMLHSSSIPATRQKTLVLFLDHLSSGEGKQILLRAMTADNQKLRKSVIGALINSGIVWIHRNKKSLLTKALQKDLKRVRFETDFIRDHMQAPTHETEEALLFLRRALTEDLNDTRELILLQLQLLKPHPLFVKAITILLSDKTAQYETALGVIQDFLPYKLYRQIKPIALLPLQAKDPTEERIVLPAVVAKDINELLMKPPFVLPAWVKATALYCLRRLGEENGMPAVLASLDDKNPVVLEAAIWALVRLQKDENVLHETLLRVPTSRLAGQSLEQILES